MTVGNADGNASWHRLELCRVQSPGLTDEVDGSESVSEEVAHAAAVQLPPTARHVTLSSAIIDCRIPHPPPLSDTRYMRPRGRGKEGKPDGQTAKLHRLKRLGAPA